MIGYLVTVCVFTVIALIAVRPPRPAHTSPAHWTYFTGAFLLNELPFVGAFWLALWTAQAAYGGNLAGAIGFIGLAVAALASILLLVVLRRGLGARAELVGALDDGLAGHPTEIDLRRPHRWARLVFAPLSFRGRLVRRHANLAYGPAGRRNLLDVYHHRDRSGGPVLVYFHGGGYRSGHKNREAKPLIHRLARRGWVCISANYRLAPAAVFPDPLIDAKSVLAWARDHAADYGGDPTTIVVAGSSAGGHLATMCALTPDVDELGRPGGDPDVHVAAAISLYGFYGAPDARPGIGASPHDHLGPTAPPIFVAHGDLDTSVLVADARSFVADLRAVSNEAVVYAELAGAHHGFDLFRSPRFAAVVDAIEVFLHRVGIHGSSPAPTTPRTP